MLFICFSIGKTKRDLQTRVKEHFRNIKNGKIEKSAVAAHVQKEKHAMDHKKVYKISREKFEPEPGFKPRTSEFLARRSTT